MRKMVIVNGSDRANTKNRFILWFGQTGTTYMMVWADHLNEASEIAVDWIVDHAPGYLADEHVQEKYDEAYAAKIELGWSEERAEEYARAHAEEDMSCWGHSGIHYIQSWEWGMVCQNPTRKQVLEMMADR